MDIKNVEKFLRCIKCGNKLIKESLQGNDGILICVDCGGRFPIINGIPRLLKGKLLKSCYYFYYKDVNKNTFLKDFFEKELKIRFCNDKIAEVKLKTANQFGYEWHMWQELPEYAENRFSEIMGRDKEYFYGKAGWDPA